jgi:hypothetical protein
MISGQTASTTGGYLTFGGLSVAGQVGDYRLHVASVKVAGTVVTDFSLADSNIYHLVHGDADHLILVTPAGHSSTANGVTTYSASADVPFEVQPKLNVVDQEGNLVSDSTAEVAVSAGSAAVSGAGNKVSRSAVAGVVDFGSGTSADLRIGGLAGTYDLTYAVVGNAAINATQTGLQLNAGAATKIRMGTQPANVIAGQAFTGGLSVEVTDNYGNLVTGSSFAITPVLVDAATGADLQTGANVNTVAGVADFSAASFTKAASAKISFRATGLASVLSAAFTVAPDAIAKVNWLVQPSTTTAAGDSIKRDPVVELLDQYGNRVTAGQNDVSIVARSIVGDQTDIVPAAGATAISVAGVATFNNLVINAPEGTYKLYVVRTVAHSVLFMRSRLARAVSAAAPTIGDGSTPIVVTYGAPHHLTIDVPASGATAGNAFRVKPVVTVRDIAGNQVDNFAGRVLVNAVGADLIGQNYRDLAVGQTAGVADFASISQGPVDLGLRGKVGSVDLVYSVKDMPSLGTITQTLNLEAGTASKLAISGDSNDIVAGAAFTQPLTVDVQDAYGNRVSGTSVTVAASLIDGTNLLNTVSGASQTGTSGTFDFTNPGLVSGVAKFTKVGSYTVKFSAQGLTAVQTSTFKISAAAPKQLAWSGIPNSVTSRGNFATAPTLTVQDEFGNTVTSSTTSVTLNAINAADATDVIDGTVSANYLAGNTASAVNGVITFSNLKIGAVAGRSYVLNATNVGDSLITIKPASSAFTLSAGAASALALNASAADAKAGLAFSAQPSVKVKDADGNVLTGDGSVINASVSNASISLVGTKTAATSATNNAATFTDLGLAGTAGTGYQITYSLATDPTISVSQTIDLTPGNAAKLFTNAAPGTLIAGSRLSTAMTGGVLSVEVQDAYGNAVKVPANHITATLVDSSGTPVVSSTATTSIAADTSSQGIADFSALTFTYAGAVKIKFEMAGAASATTSLFTIRAGDPAKLVWFGAWGTTPAHNRVAISDAPKLRIVDVNGNPVASTFGATVTVAAVHGIGNTASTMILGATSISSNGVLDFGGITIGGQADSYSLKIVSASFTKAGSVMSPQPTTDLTAVSPSVNLLAGEANKLMVTQEADGAKSGKEFTTQPVVVIADVDGNTVEASDPAASATVSMTTNASSMIQNSGLAATNGRAVFGSATGSSLGIRGIAGRSYRLTFTAAYDVTDSSNVVAHKTLTVQQPSLVALGAGVTQRAFAW